MVKSDIKISDEMPDTDKVAEIIQAGVLYSHAKSKAHPRMKPFIGANRHEIDILDVRAVLSSLEGAIKFLQKVVDGGGVILFVGTTLPIKSIIEGIAKKFDQPYVVNRWLGGTLTNFKVIGKRSQHYQDLKKKQEGGELEKYTKKEQLQFTEEIERLSRNFDGLEKLEKMPDVLFIVDVLAHGTAIAEAKGKGIPIVAIIDSNDDPESVTYPIIANDHTRSSVLWVMEHISGALKKK